MARSRESQNGPDSSGNLLKRIRQRLRRHPENSVTEYEKRFLVLYIPSELKAQMDAPDYSDYVDIEQAYLSDDERIRKETKPTGEVKYTYARKIPISGTQGFGKTEKPESLSEEEYEYLLEGKIGRAISKRRHFISDMEGLTVQLDIFKGMYEDDPLDGKMLAEVEIESPGENQDAYQKIRNFRAFPWFVKKHVTDLISTRKLAMGTPFPNAIAA